MLSYDKKEDYSLIPSTLLSARQTGFAFTELKDAGRKRNGSSICVKSFANTGKRTLRMRTEESIWMGCVSGKHNIPEVRKEQCGEVGLKTAQGLCAVGRNSFCG